MTIEVPLDQITIGERRRQDYGDIPGLMKGFRRVGQLSAIIVDRNGGKGYRLVAGGRRLQAARQLGWNTIRAELKEHLTDDELRDIELEENENRKNLDEAERTKTFKASKKVVEDAKKAGITISDQSGPKKDPRGRKPEYGKPKDDIAKDLGVGITTLKRAETQVAAWKRL